MSTRSESRDRQLLAEALAPPDLGDGIQSLRYWRSRRRKLSWYRVHARREAERMIARWERRVGAALVAQPTVTPGLRLSGGLLLAQSRVGRWLRRARTALIVTGLLSAVLLAAVAVAALAFLSRIF
jgi:hypothetical protein